MHTRRTSLTGAATIATATALPGAAPSLPRRLPASGDAAVAVRQRLLDRTAADRMLVQG